MSLLNNSEHPATPPMAVSPLLLSHHLLSMAQDADRAGLPQSAVKLLRLAQSICTDRPRRR